MAVKKATIKQLQGTTLIAKGTSNHWVTMDGGPNTEGSEAASTPKELLMFALGGCTAMDVIPILKKKRVPVEGVEINVTGNTRDEHPQVFTDLHVEYIIYGENINPADVERAIELSITKYCSVSAMIAKAAKLTHSYLIKPSKTATLAEEISTN